MIQGAKATGFEEFLLEVKKLKSDKHTKPWLKPLSKNLGSRYFFCKTYILFSIFQSIINACIKF